MANENQQKVLQSIASAQALFSNPDFIRKSGMNNVKGKRNHGSDLSLFEQQAFGKSYSQSTPSQTLDGGEVDNSLENVTAAFTQMPMMPNNISASQQMLSESLPNPYTQPQSIPMQGGIDYNYIKFIISECIKEQLGGNLLNENLAGLRIGDGNKIQLMDRAGNIFEGQLKLKKKANK